MASQPYFELQRNTWCFFHFDISSLRKRRVRLVEEVNECSKYSEGMLMKGPSAHMIMKYLPSVSLDLILPVICCSQ
jgi:hypothetical protein